MGRGLLRPTRRSMQQGPTQRDGHLAMIAEQGRLAWQASTGYGQRSLIETTMGRYKTLIGPRPPGFNRWVLKYVPLLDQQFRARKRPVGASWRMDETYVRVKGASARSSLGGACRRRQIPHRRLAPSSRRSVCSAPCTRCCSSPPSGYPGWFLTQDLSPSLPRPIRGLPEEHDIDWYAAVSAAHRADTWAA